MRNNVNFLFFNIFILRILKLEIILDRDYIEILAKRNPCRHISSNK